MSSVFSVHDKYFFTILQESSPLDKFHKIRYTHLMNKLNVGIFAHIDAGKTTLTERLLLLAGEIRHAGSVDGGTSATDFLPVERRRGISVRDASVTLHAYGAEIHIIDTPGHADFIEETELALGAIDVAVLVLSATEGVQAQTELLLSAIQRRNLPIVIFYNKCDREPAPPLDALKKLCNAELLAFDAPDFTENALTALGDEKLLSGYLDGNFDEQAFWRQLDKALMRGEIYPLLFGSARTGEQCDFLLKILACYTCPRDETAPFSAYVYQITHHKTFGKLAHVRILTGSLAVRGEVPNRRTQSVLKATQLKFVQGEKLTDTSILKAGDVGAVAGLADARAGDLLGEESGLPAPSLASPYLRVKVIPRREEDLPAVKAALEELTDESPSFALEWAREKRELIVSAAGPVQMEILRDTMSERYGLNVDMGTPSVVYRETPIKAAYGFEAYTMPKPCWAVVRFYIEPLPRGSGFRYESICSEKKIAYRYQNHVETCVPRVLTQGLYGWQVTDLKVTLVDGEDHPQHTHPLDFFVATPMGVMDGLRNCGTRLLEPVLSVTVSAPQESLGKVIAEISPRRAEMDAPVVENERFRLRADVPAAEAMDLQERLLSLTGGKAVYDARLKGYYPCPDGMGETRERTGENPLDRARWILHARGAL